MSVSLLIVEFSRSVSPAYITASPELSIASVILVVWAISRNMAKLLTDETWAICSSHRNSLVWRSNLILRGDKRSHWEIYRHWRQKVLLGVLKDSRATTKALRVMILSASFLFLEVIPFLPPNLSFNLCRAML